MGAAYFYHLTRNPLEHTLPILLGKALGAGWRVTVRGASLEGIARLDDSLWNHPEEGFLPHGLDTSETAADQPVLLTCGMNNLNNSACLMTVHGADITADEVNALERVCVLFDGADGAAVQHARVQWKALTDAGCSAQYWSEESGVWEKKAER